MAKTKSKINNKAEGQLNIEDVMKQEFLKKDEKVGTNSPLAVEIDSQPSIKKSVQKETLKTRKKRYLYSDEEKVFILNSDLKQIAEKFGWTGTKTDAEAFPAADPDHQAHRTSCSGA